MTSARVAGEEAIVLRTLRYGEADLIAHLATREHGRRNVIAKGALRTRSRLGARLDPFLVVGLQVRAGRGDLGIVQGVEVLAGHDGIRGNWRRQRVAADIVDLLARLLEPGVPNEPAYHLTRRALAELDAADLDAPGAEEGRAAAITVGFQLKLLHAAGISPQLAACVRCGAGDGLRSWSASDGGVACGPCHTPGDAALDGESRELAMWLTTRPLAELAQAVDEVVPPALARAVSRLIVAGMAREHAGVRARPLA